jgi:hypothetical protein
MSISLETVKNEI